MKNTLRTITGMGFAAIMITACADKQEETTEEEQTSTVGPTTTVSSTPTPRPTPTPSTPSPTDFSATPTPAPTPTPQVQNYSRGVPEPGKPGYVRSPYNPDSGLVDVRGIPPGTEVRDPYSGRIFLVP